MHSNLQAGPCPCPRCNPTTHPMTDGAYYCAARGDHYQLVNGQVQQPRQPITRALIQALKGRAS